MRNKEMTILKALGIIFVVMGHKDDPFSWFPAYSFHMALFFFVSGYFYKEKYENNILLYITRKIKKTIPLYFSFNLFYMIVTFILYKKYKILLGSLPNLKAFFITPFTSGNQFELYLAAWFILALLIIQIVFIVMYKCIKKINENIHVHLLIFFVIGIIGTYIAKYVEFTNRPLILILIRTCFGLFFYYLGFYYKQNESRNIFSSAGLLTALIIQVIVLKNFINIPYYVVEGKFDGHVILPYVTSVTGIYVYLFLSKALSKFLKDNDILYKIGDNTLSIMINHIFVFFIVNYVIIKLKHGGIDQLGNVFFSYKLGSYWLMYDILGVLVPVYLARFFNVFKVKIISHTKVKI